MPKYSIEALDDEFTNVLNSFSSHRTKQNAHVEYYNTSAFYQPLPGEQRRKRVVGVNLLRAFADKNINYTSKFPIIKMPPRGTDMEARRRTALNEKILYSTWETSNGEMLQADWAEDATLMAEAFALTEFDLRTREVRVGRLDPRFCYYKYTNPNDQKISAFFVAYVMTKDEIKARWNVDPGRSGIGSTMAAPDGQEVPVDGEDRFWVIGRWDRTTRVWWTGNKFLEEPHKHMMPFIPVSRVAPIRTKSLDRKGGFFLAPLVEPQAEINETLRKKINVIRKLSNPTVYGRGVIAAQFDEIKKALKGDGGFVGLKANGELGFLQLKETALLDNHMVDMFQKMKDIAGFPTAAFGEIMGANTSGDALSMYFQPTTQAIENQWIRWAAFYRDINSKILCLYHTFLTATETKELYGSYPRGTFEYVEAGDGTIERKYATGGYGVTFTKEDVDQTGRTKIITPSATPKDEMAYKRLLLDANSTGLFSKVSIYEEWGAADPEDELDLLATEKEDPRLNPEGFAQVANAIQPGAPGGMPPGVTPPVDPSAQPTPELDPAMAGVGGGEYVE